MSEDGLSLDSQMATILLQLELLSAGHVQSWNSSGSPSGEPDDRMVGEVARQARLHLLDRPPWMVFRSRYDGCRNDKARLKVIELAQEELDGWRKRTAPLASTKTDVDFILEDGVGWDPEWVARRYGVTSSFVRKTRREHDRGEEDGRSTAPRFLAPVKQDRQPEALALRAQKFSTREIAERLEVSQTLVMRWVRDSAGEEASE